ncbi:DUF3500 domain-containing protein [Amycolatopsis alkalitolerans]|uniref:DUF3500 domain-containing protein n=1 Tax=Amycolatopsis alkalitolerans TaxID=2547244 RepID=A0A5C4LNY6_9PSEU|nr:DUF3500 domain-containing protein [Amycolatopsis alkalitolerans]TNC18719.1 DUF3500 domain-containing protein [Amycolatopsis alkalitolerans]
MTEWAEPGTAGDVGIAALISRMSEAATAFLSLLSDEQRSATMLDFADEGERRRWFYTPTARPGLALLDMTPEQSQALFKMLAVGLSEYGYGHVCMVIGMEHVLDYRYGFPARAYGGTPGTRIRHPGNYRVAVFGVPGPHAWSWRIGGHHVALQFTVRGGEISVTPAFFGGEPARAEMAGGAVLRMMAGEEDTARALMASLDGEQRRVATICPVPPTDIVQENAPTVGIGAIPTIGGEGPGGQVLRDYLRLTREHDEMYRYTAAPKGLTAAGMSSRQRQRLVHVIRTYFSHLAAPIGAQYEHVFDSTSLNGTAFAWAGPAEPGAAHYYRIQGERLLIEYNCAQNGANHKHSVWRDPTGDFGDALYTSRETMC